MTLINKFAYQKFKTSVRLLFFLLYLALYFLDHYTPRIPKKYTMTFVRAAFYVSKDNN